jgi:hypothetical protein
MMAPSTRVTECTVTIHCKTCGAPLEEAAMDRTRGLARCGHCDTVVELDFERSQPEARAPHERAPVAMPEGFELERQPGALVIRWSWFRMKYVLWFLFTAAWLFGMASYYTDIFSSTGPTGGQVTAQMVLFPMLHVAVGLILAYVTICGFINTTTVTARDGHLDVRHAPLPWPGNGTVSGIRQLYSKEKVHRGKRGRVSYSYELHAVTSAGKRKLVGRLEEAAQALWLEQTLERRLHIEDRPVGGELPRH